MSRASHSPHVEFKQVGLQAIPTSVAPSPYSIHMNTVLVWIVVCALATWFAIKARSGERPSRPNHLSFASIVHGEVEICDASTNGARFIAVASLYGKTQVRVCQKNTSA